MTREERNYKLKKFITCLKCEVSGKCCDDNCPTQYEAGNMGEIIENLEAISNVLEREPKLEWTPASNPPKQDGKYLVTTHSFNHDKIEVLGYANNLYEIDNYNFWNMERAGWYGYDDEYGYFEIDEVVAWCELPKPYKESEGNET